MIRRLRRFVRLLGKVLPMSMEHSGDLTINRVTYSEMTDAELAAIASRGRAGNDAAETARPRYVGGGCDKIPARY
jgi:hypothetical protein